MKTEELLHSILGDDSNVVRPLLGGMMNESYVVNKNNKNYVLYISTKQANEMVNRPLEKKHIDIISELGITSKNVYFDSERGIKVNEFIEGNSTDKVDQFDYQKIANILHTLHSSKVLSPEDYLPFKRFEGYESEALSFVKQFSEEYLLLRNELMANKYYLEGQEKVLSHNDFQRSNIVKADDGNYFVIDFEFVGNNDEIYDIACFGNGLVEEGYNLLEAYFQNPTNDQKKRYYLWRIYVSLQWYTVALVKHYRGEGAVHGFDFLAVASHFLDNAKTAYKYLKVLEK